MAKYTMALKEHGDRIAEKPFYRFITVSLNPPWFQVDCVLERAEGVWRSRKQKGCETYCLHEDVREAGYTFRLVKT